MRSVPEDSKGFLDSHHRSPASVTADVAAASAIAPNALGSPPIRTMQGSPPSSDSSNNSPASILSQESPSPQREVVRLETSPLTSPSALFPALRVPVATAPPGCHPEPSSVAPNILDKWLCKDPGTVALLAIRLTDQDLPELQAAIANSDVRAHFRAEDWKIIATKGHKLAKAILNSTEIMRAHPEIEKTIRNLVSSSRNDRNYPRR